ncbi:MAG: SUMF1/EgtB/PvdO family nonheme iron enzyme [Deltaproteobacteria bacterium]|nr:SUMF1/EgtB/PvdO family nonheme iron enzyme [Deltaproteobacteria bacterium]
MDAFESLLESLVPGTGRAPEAGGTSRFPLALGLEPGPLLGRGAHGEVVRAHDPALARDVAVKISLPGASAEDRAAILREASITASLEHPAVLAVHRVHEEQELVAVQYQLAPALTLERRLADASPEQEWPLLTRVRMLVGVASAVARAHQLGVVHGDLHGGNIAIDADGEPYVLDWSSVQSAAGPSFSGHPSTAAPEQLRGSPPTPASDVHALGALLWELIALRPLRPRRHDESLGDFVARWRDASSPLAPEEPGVPSGLRAACNAALAFDPSARPSSAEVRDQLAACLGAQAEEARRTGEASVHLARARDGLSRFRELGERYVQEERVALVQRTKVAEHAPIAQKRPLWDAEDRVLALAAEQTEVWTAATESATLAASLDPTNVLARSVMAELWWERLHDAETHYDPLTAAVAERRVQAWDDGRYTRVLCSDSTVSLDLVEPVEGATVILHRYVEKDRVLVAEKVAELPMPLVGHPLAPGSWLLEVHAEGYSPSRYPVQLGRVQNHRGSVRLLTPDQIGDGWVFVPGGAFRLGGDPRARQPLDPCEPILGDLLVQRTCVTSREWQRFLDAIPEEEARLHVPGEAGLFGSFQPFWTREDGAWTLPDGWNPDWPVFAVNVADAEVYATWLSEREGRRVRLPTEEEWEKASRGVDGRSYPWGNAFDPTFAHMRSSKPGPPRPSAVGVYPQDCSVYGVLDTSGGMREWTSSLFDEGANVIRGGTWGDDAHDMLCANRAGLMPMIRYSYVSFRLVTDELRLQD